jgi:hypothetical protein
MSEQKTTEQIQYEKLTSLFKTYAGFLTTFLTILSGLTIFLPIQIEMPLEKIINRLLKN